MQEIAQFLHGFLPGLHGQLIFVTYLKQMAQHSLDKNRMRMHTFGTAAEFLLFILGKFQGYHFLVFFMYTVQQARKWMGLVHSLQLIDFAIQTASIILTK